MPRIFLTARFGRPERLERRFDSGNLPDLQTVEVTHMELARGDVGDAAAVRRDARRLDVLRRQLELAQR